MIMIPYETYSEKAGQKRSAPTKAAGQPAANGRWPGHIIHLSLFHMEGERSR
jgi:hypothetical protein